MTIEIKLIVPNQCDDETSREIETALTGVLPAAKVVTGRAPKDSGFVASVVALTIGGVVLSGGILLLQGFLNGAGEKAGQSAADSLLSLFRTSRKIAPRYVNRKQMEEIQSLPENERSAAWETAGDPVAPVVIRIENVPSEDGEDFTFSFRFPFELNEIQFLEALRSLGPEYPQTLRRLAIEDNARYGTRSINAIYDPVSRQWLGSLRAIKTWRERSEAETQRMIDAQNEEKPES